jgi:hypothetical protein
MKAVVASVLLLSFLGSLRGDSTCLFTGSWYIEGEGVDTASGTSLPISGSVKVFEANGYCWVNYLLVTPWTSFCCGSKLSDQGSNWMNFNDFVEPVWVTVYLTGENLVTIQSNSECPEQRDGPFYASAVPGVRATKMLDYCVTYSNYFFCNARRIVNATW